jgi:DNA (cytosine-5)-methyltransferase 1
MNHGSLFSGIGGFDLAAEWMGWNNTFHCEWMPFPRKVLSHYFPNSISYEDITKTDFSIHRGTIDILTGGFPCQPYSSAGKRLGKEDERHLWPHMLRVISEVKPTYVVGENVRGLTNWNGGVVFEEVCTDLESQGYTVQPILLPACAVGAPHRRDRIWFVATNTECFRLQHSEKRGDIQESTGKTRCERSEFTESIKANGGNGIASNSDSGRIQTCTQREVLEQSNTERQAARFINDVIQGNATNTNDKGLQRWKINGNFTKKEREGEFYRNITRQISNKWENFPTQPPICSGDDGLPTKLDGITFSKWRQESIKGYGNAIVPQVAYEIFKVIAEMDRLEKLQLKLF